MLYDLGAPARQDRHRPHASQNDGLTTASRRRTRWASLHFERHRHGTRTRTRRNSR
jgi:hypothetical protein